jgi:predicted MPP superfamily phosphohydrolase
VDGALAQLTDDAPALAFMHNPDLFPRLSDRYALVLAGHTHGGQVALPVLGRPIVPSRYGERYAAGHVVEHGRHLYVTTGLGTSILPVRFRVPPEIALLSVRAGAR